MAQSTEITLHVSTSLLERIQIEFDTLWDALSEVQDWAASTDRFACLGCKTSTPTQDEPGYCTCGILEEEYAEVEFLSRRIWSALKGVDIQLISRDRLELAYHARRCQLLMRALLVDAHATRQDYRHFPEELLQELA